MIRIKFWYTHEAIKQTRFKTGNFKSFNSFKWYFENKFKIKGYILQGFEQVFNNQIDLFKN